MMNSFITQYSLSIYDTAAGNWLAFLIFDVLHPDWLYTSIGNSDTQTSCGQIHVWWLNG